MSLKKEIERYSKLNGYPISDYYEITCSCGCNEFHVFSDDEEGGAYVVCPGCGEEKDIEDSRQYIEKALNNVCNCENDHLVIGVGKAYYEASNDPRWVYIGCHCNKCGLDGVYVDWKQN